MTVPGFMTALQPILDLSPMMAPNFRKTGIYPFTLMKMVTVVLSSFKLEQIEPAPMFTPAPNIESPM